jgi:hypothetical protein
MYASLRWIGKPSHAAEGKDPETGTVDPPISAGLSSRLDLRYSLQMRQWPDKQPHFEQNVPLGERIACVTSTICAFSPRL